ncbi:unnamed protein product [Prorocentrum cordatum]|uniref:Hexosyltransferase n=1 Tax=Prorocentrum cordatum TaxID=2364126 RepID=A0ABN9T1B6_9DINO|nr:unnamed protein product [Polarella glacialis]
MDSDTYIFRNRVNYLVSELKLPTVDHIAMAKDGCKDEFNSGVMVFKPDLEVFKAMLVMLSQRRREQILDQTLINDYYKGKIFPIDRMFNCVDTVGIQPGGCSSSCGVLAPPLWPACTRTSGPAGSGPSTIATSAGTAEDSRQGSRISSRTGVLLPPALDDRKGETEGCQRE